MTLYKKNIRVLVIEPPVQRPSFDKARPNGGLGPAYLVGALRKHGIEVDYLDASVGQKGRNLKETFYNRSDMENGASVSPMEMTPDSGRIKTGNPSNSSLEKSKNPKRLLSDSVRLI